jgi:hypothetical protein
MWQRSFRLIGLLSLMVLALLSGASAQATNNSRKNPLRTVADVPLPGAAVRFDYQSLDSTKGILYIAHMNADQLVVFDTASRKVLANLNGFAFFVCCRQATCDLCAAINRFADRQRAAR